jgi:hypothetical protein
LDSKAAREDVLVSQAIRDPAVSADTLRTRIKRVLERSWKIAPAYRFAEGLGMTAPCQAPRQHVKNGFIAVLVMALELYSLPLLLHLVGWRLAALFLCGAWATWQAHAGIVVEDRVADRLETRVEHCQMVSAEMQNHVCCDEH